MLLYSRLFRHALDKDHRPVRRNKSRRRPSNYSEINRLMSRTVRARRLKTKPWVTGRTKLGCHGPVETNGDLWPRRGHRPLDLTNSPASSVRGRWPPINISSGGIVVSRGRERHRSGASRRSRARARHKNCPADVKSGRPRADIYPAARASWRAGERTLLREFQSPLSRPPGRSFSLASHVRR